MTTQPPIEYRLKKAIGGLRSIAYGEAQTWPNCSSREVAKQALIDCCGEKYIGDASTRKDEVVHNGDSPTIGGSPSEIPVIKWGEPCYGFYCGCGGCVAESNRRKLSATEPVSGESLSLDWSHCCEEKPSVIVNGVHFYPVIWPDKDVSNAILAIKAHLETAKSKEQPVELSGDILKHVRAAEELLNFDGHTSPQTTAKTILRGVIDIINTQPRKATQSDWPAIRAVANAIYDTDKRGVIAFVEAERMAEAAISALPMREMADERKPSYKTLLILLQNLVHLKKHKDSHGKDAYYEAAQPLAWRNTIEALSQIEDQGVEHVD